MKVLLLNTAAAVRLRRAARVAPVRTADSVLSVEAGRLM